MLDGCPSSLVRGSQWTAIRQPSPPYHGCVLTATTIRATPGFCSSTQLNGNAPRPETKLRSRPLSMCGRENNDYAICVFIVISLVPPNTAKVTQTEPFLRASHIWDRTRLILPKVGLRFFHVIASPVAPPPTAPEG